MGVGMSQETESQTPEFPLNQELLDEANRAMQDWKVLQERLDKISESKHTLSPVVFERVLSDYQQKKNAAEEKLLSFKAELDRELQMLDVTQVKLSQQVDEHRHSLEEIDFRNSLGEFSASEYKNRAKQEKDKLQKLETLLAAVQKNITQYQSIFSGNEQLFADDTSHEISEVSKSVSKSVTARHDRDTISALDKLSLSSTHDDEEPMTDDSGYIVEEREKNYFAAGDDEKTPHFTDELKTEINRPATEAAGAKLVVVGGKDSGSVYKLKDVTSLGRADNNTIHLHDNKASRQHSKIQRKGKEYVITDLNSSNGTYVNGERIEEYVLNQGDEVKIGDSVLQFQL